MQPRLSAPVGSNPNRPKFIEATIGLAVLVVVLSIAAKAFDVNTNGPAIISDHTITIDKAETLNRQSGELHSDFTIIEATVALSHIQAVEPGAITSKCAASATTIVVTSSPVARALSS